MRPHLIAGAVLTLGVALLIAGILIGPPTVGHIGEELLNRTTSHGNVDEAQSFYVTGPVYDALSPNDGNTLMGAGTALIAVAVVGETVLVMRRRRSL